jgi:hypothetical protein
MTFKAVEALAEFADEAVLHADRLIALSGQGLNWIAEIAPRAQVEAGLPAPDMSKRFFIGEMESNMPKPNATVTTLGDITSKDRLDDALSWLTAACLIEICAYWRSEAQARLAEELHIGNPKYFEEPVLEAAVLRRNEYIHGFRYSRKDLPELSPFSKVTKQDQIVITQNELRDFRDYIVNDLAGVTAGEWSAFAVMKR